MLPLPRNTRRRVYRKELGTEVPTILGANGIMPFAQYLEMDVCIYYDLLCIKSVATQLVQYINLS